MKIIGLYIVLLVWTVFNYIPYDGQLLAMFPFSDVVLPFKTWLYFALEHIGIIILSFLLAAEERKYKFSCELFFWLQVLDLADYLLTYNSVWFRIGFDVSFNVLALVIFTASIIHEHGRSND